MSTLRTLRRAGGAVPDLWLRLRARLAEHDRVEIALPPFRWPAALAAATAIGTVVVVPEPVRFLTAIGIL